MVQKHTPGPWAHRNGRIYQADRDVLTIANISRAFDGNFSEANARRIVACVNACRGLSTDELERFGLASAFGTELIELEKQRDQLLESLEFLLADADLVQKQCLREIGIGLININATDKARSAIATVKEQK